jgi:hypothetical protein
MTSKCRVAAVGALTAMFSSAAPAANWVESVNGDLSDNGQAPTALVFDLGPNTITGTMGSPPSGPLDADVFRFTLEPGEQLSSIVVESITPGDASFYAIAAGPTIDMNDGMSHLSNILIAEPGEYFDDLASPVFGGMGITQPLGPGEYTVWFQETAQVRDYVMRYTVVVPEPASLTAVAVSAALLGRRGRRR